MTISSSQSFIYALGTNSATSFQFPFPTDSASDINVYYIDGTGNQTLLVPSQYSITLNPLIPGSLWQTGGSVTYPLVGGPIAIGTSLLIQRNIPLLQETSISNQGNVYPQVTEEGLDLLEMQLQQVAARTGQFRGIWASGIIYNYADIVVDGANGADTMNYYMCVLANTSGTWTTDLANGDWTLIINIQQINADVASANASAAAAAISATNAGNSASSASSSASTATTEAGIATTESGIATTQATNAAASAAQAAIYATAAANINATSTTSQAITTGSVTFTTQAGKLFVIGEYVTIASGANVANYMYGQVTSYSGTSLVVNVTATSGTGTHADWNIMLAGIVGPAGTSGAGASPAGTPGQIQYYSLTSTTFAGFTASGDATINTGSGTITVTKTQGTPFAPSATTDTTNAANITSGTLASARGGAGVVNGILKGSGSGVVTAATLNVDFQGPITLTTTGTSGTATFNGSTLNIPVYSGATGSVTSITFTGDGTVLSATPSAAITGTGTLTATLLAVTPKSVLGNTSTSTFQPTFVTAPVVSGVSTASAFNPTGSATTTGFYLAAANTPGISANSLQVARFIGSGTGADYATFQSQSAGSGPIIGVGSSGSAAPLNLTSLGTSSIIFYSNNTGTTLGTFANAGSLTLNVANATVSAGSFSANGTVTPINGIYVPASNTLTVASASKIVATFNTPGTGGDYLSFQNVSSSGISAVTAPTACTIALAGLGSGTLSSGNYTYKISYVGTLGETAIGTISNTINVTSPATNGKMALTAIPVSGSGTVTARNIYRTQANGSTYYFLSQLTNNTSTTFTDNTSDAALTFSAPTSVSQLPTYITIGASPGTSGDTSVGIQYRALGTTTTGNQYDGNLGSNSSPISSTGDHQFFCNNQKALRITDNYINASNPYSGAANTWAVISSGFNLAGSDGLAMISAESSIYPGTSIGTGLVLGSKGAGGQIHFLSNGMLGHVTISAPTNPIAPDTFVANNSLRLAGAATGNGDVVLFSQPSGNPADTAIGMSFYNAGSGNFSFLSDNTATLCFRMFEAANGVNALYTRAAATGNVPLLGAGWNGPFSSSDTNCALGLTSNGTGSVFIYSNSAATTLATFANAGSLTLNVANSVLTAGSLVVNGTTVPANGIYLPTASTPTIAANSVAQFQVTTTAAALNLLSVTGGASGNGPTITVGGATVQTNAGINYAALGSGSHIFRCAGSNAVSITGAASAVNTFSISASTTGNSPSISAQGGDSNVGLVFYSTGTGDIRFLTNNTANDLVRFSNSGAINFNTGKIATYNGIATAGYGVPAIFGYGRSTAQAAAVASVATYTVGASDGSFQVSANALITSSTTYNFSVTCTYHDEGNTARTATFNFANAAGTIANVIGNAGGAVPYMGIPLHIRCKAATAITIATSGSFSSVAYNIEGVIAQTD